MKKVSEVAELLKISKQAVHKRLKNPKYQSYIEKRGSTIYIHDDLIAILKVESDNQKHQPVDEKADNEVDNKVVEMYERLLKSKDESIERLSKEVDDIKHLLENQQILTLNFQNEIKLLKDDSKLEEIKEPKGFFKSFFNR